MFASNATCSLSPTPVECPSHGLSQRLVIIKGNCPGFYYLCFYGTQVSLLMHL